ncbi:alkaline phosphatase family protein [Alteribacillus iranensis]|uniref:Predicted pyrophosphatase or phosphodiesterase, AlkP superfamily n=1 Tax=Alteribacillus iranensis TaxID=930128 RepID=A0A1I2BLM8_9BACI|nr:ectonucleotide pyrophosphatase/phosphodiesterase [Alteribacillus iranensis]SFE56173.1 Predicted pyrophosphatase or phosphodiesterase, AlkP superfamily [Alteribacillus iranensis]
MERRVIMICIDGMAGYYLHDSQCKMPNLHKLLQSGVHSKNVTTSYPSSTWIANTSIVTGVHADKHGVLGNWVVDRHTKQVKQFFGDRDFNKEDVVKVPTIYDVAHDNQLNTAALCWPVTRGAEKLDWNIPEFYEQELFEEWVDEGFWNELKQAGLPVEQYGIWSKDHARGPMQDWLTTEIGKHLLKNHQPEVLLMHYLTADSFQHDYGVQTPEAYWALEYIDRMIGDLIQTLEEQSLLEETHILLVSDHGFSKVDQVFAPNVLFKQKGWLNEAEPEKSDVIAVSNGGSGYIYILNETKKETLREEVKEALQSYGCVEHVYEADAFESLHLPQEEENRFTPDFVCEVSAPYFVYYGSEGEDVLSDHPYRGMHGFLPAKEDLKALFIGAGPQFKPNQEIESMSTVDIAPTIARLLGLDMKNTDGRVLEEGLKQESFL